MKINPLFKHFGSKWSSGKLYPKPEYQVIVEPFAGAAGYSLNHTERSVVLYDTDENIRDLWRYLIHSATSEEIRDIPLNLPEGTDIRAIGLNYGQQLLLKHWQRTNNVGSCWTVSAWGSKPGQWTANTRARVAEEIHAIKHWLFLDYSPFDKPDSEVTWFIDPPYQNNYAYRQPIVDFERLGQTCRSLKGQVIVCEGVDKNGNRANWLPFRDFAERVTSRRKVHENHHCKELIWTNK